jgi:NADH-quinone oxidoreductase subunit N
VFYLAVYLFMNMAAFAVIVARERETGLGDTIAAVRGLGRERPHLAWPMTLAMLGLAGIPATAGFMGKFYLIEAAVSGNYIWLGVVIVIGSMISLGYYLPVVAAMWMSAPEAAASPADAQATAPSPVPGAAPGSGISPAPEGSLPAIAGGSPELDGEGSGEPDAGPVQPDGDQTPAQREAPPALVTGRQPEVALVAVLAGAATLFFGIIPQPLFDLVHGVGGALGLL